MSENEKSLRDWVMMVAEHTPRIRAAGLGLLDALLSEHRAEVERLTAERDDWKGRAESRQGEIERQMVERQREWQGKQNEAAAYERTVAALRAEVEHLKKDKEALHLCYEAAKAREPVAHDAAMEEAAMSFNGLCVDCQQGPVNPEHERCWHEHDSATRIRALKSQPARQYVDVEKVREVFNAIIATDRDRLPMHDRDVGDLVLMEAARRLGVDLDAGGECEGAADCGWHNGGPCPPCRKSGARGLNPDDVSPKP